MISFKICFVTPKADRVPPAKHIPADSLFLPLACCPLMERVHVWLNLPAKLYEDTAYIISPHHKFFNRDVRSRFE